MLNSRVEVSIKEKSMLLGYSNAITYNKSLKITKNFMKVIGLIAMLIDHIGHAIFPDLILLRIIGRLAFPIFAYQLTIGYGNTSDLGRYLLRLFLFGLISQYPYALIFGGTLNIFFTLLLGLFAIYSIDRKRYLALALCFALPMLLPFEYGYYGLVTIVAFYLFRDRMAYIILSQVAINLVYLALFNAPIQAYSLIALLFIYKKWNVELPLNKYFFYSFYPLHILILYLVTVIK